MKYLRMILVALAVAWPAAVVAQDAPEKKAGEERRNGPMRLLELADENKDGKTTYDEIKKLAPKFPEENFKQMDKDGDGALTAAELPQRGERGAGLIQRADKDGDKRVSKDEFKEAFPKSREERFTRLDTNKDGYFDTKDAPAEVLSIEERQARSLEQLIKRADKDADSKVTPEEFKAALPNAPETRFKSLDTNGDGALTKEDAPAPAGEKKDAKRETQPVKEEAKAEPKDSAQPDKKAE